MAADIPLAIEHMRYYAGWATKIVGQTIPVSGDYFNYTRHEAVGVVGQIILGTSRFLWQCGKWEQRLLQDVQSFKTCRTNSTICSILS